MIDKGVWLALKRGLLSACCAMALTGSTRAQDLVQAVVDGLTDPNTAREAGILVEQQPGVQMARFDVHTRNMMLHVSADCVMHANGLNALLLPLGIQIRCYQRRDAREAPYQHLVPARCADQPTIAR